jgi:hypothetical protein
MSKPLTYRGVQYTMAKGPSLTDGRLRWMGLIAVGDGRLRLVREAETKGEVLKAIKSAISPASQHAGRIRKLRRMTEANGCTPAEAATARAKLQQLEARP